MKRYLWIAPIGLALVAVIIICVIVVRGHHSVRDGSSGAPETPEVSLVDQKTLSSLPHRSASSANTDHLGTGVLPPTNTWLSGMVLQQPSDAVYPMPLSFLAKNNGFEIGLPTITSTPTQISGEHTPGITVQIPASSFQLTRFDKVSATLTYRNNAQPVGTVTLAEGSPFVFYTAASSSMLTLAGINPADIQEHTGQYVRYNLNGHTYVASTGDAEIRLTNDTVLISLKPGETVTLYTLNGTGTNDTLKQYAGNILRSVQVTHVSTGQSVKTTFAYHTADGKPTIFVPLPYTNVSGQSVTSYQGLYGQMQALVGNAFTSTVAAVAPSSKLDLSRLSGAQKQTLASMLTADTNATSIPDQDSYYAGKELARAANLLSIAQQLGQSSDSTRLKEILNQAFAARLTPQYFYYDTKLKGIAATTPGFGSQDFNDHHFHYGYWLYAGSILAQYDSTFVSSYRSQMDLLAADIANYQPSSEFPLTRTYDPYAEHSWAGGLAPFADGNDQESSSEAIHAWNGVSLWGEVTHNQALTQTGEWMLANEAHSAAATWRSVDTSDPALHGYTSPVVGIAFGGKRVYSTWFSDSSAAKLGIQLIPMDPSMTSFASDTHIASTVSASLQNNNFNVSLGDYALMYLSLANPKQAAQLAKSQTNIDNGDSKTYLNAFIDAQLDK